MLDDYLYNEEDNVEEVVKKEKPKSSYPFYFLVEGKTEDDGFGTLRFTEKKYVKAYGKTHADAYPKVVEFAKDLYGNKWAGGIERWDVTFPVPVPENVYVETLK